jgi:hypothetical protein
MSYTKSNNIQAGTSDNAVKPQIITDKDGNIVAYTDANGFQAIRYRDEYVGGVWLTPTGAAAPDVVTVTIGGVSTQKNAFDGGNTEERLANNFEIPHDMAITEVNAGTLKVEWHVHFRPSTTGTGNVKWFLDYCYTPPPVNGTSYAPIPQTSLSAIKTILANNQYYQYIIGVELPIPLGGFDIGGIITFNLRRTPTDTEDTYNADVLLIKSALHVPTNDFGSRQRYIK